MLPMQLPDSEEGGKQGWAVWEINKTVTWIAEVMCSAPKYLSHGRYSVLTAIDYSTIFRDHPCNIIASGSLLS